MKKGRRERTEADVLCVSVAPFAAEREAPQSAVMSIQNRESTSPPRSSPHLQQQNAVTFDLYCLHFVGSNANNDFTLTSSLITSTVTFAGHINHRDELFGLRF